jgi:ATP-dependent exoDNAse (exonuclease V) alpha subunit
VLIVDEAAMVSTEHLSKLTAAARESGAKLILCGDDAQLSSIERGGMFETPRMSHGAAVLKDVQRVKDAAQKVAFCEMHQGEFMGALQLAEKAGRLHWTSTQTDTLRDMAVKYTADLAATPDKMPLASVQPHRPDSSRLCSSANVIEQHLRSRKAR